MSFSPKMLVLAGLVVAAMVVLMAMTMGGGQEKLYYLEVQEFVAKPNNNAVRLAGFVQDGSIGKDVSGLTVNFMLRDATGKVSVPVRFDARQSGGRIPDTFVDGSQVVVSGKLAAGGVFEANQLLAKCPSKYEAEDKAKKKTV